MTESTQTQLAFLADKYENHTCNYQEYELMIHNLMAEGKTTGTNHSESMLHYTKMNLQRMSRLQKTVRLNDEFTTLSKEKFAHHKWMILTEAWCGDAAQNIPIFNAIGELLGVEPRYILRDEHLDLMDEFLVNGGRSIPVLIAMDADYNVLFSWGPRPKPAQKKVLDYKANPVIPYAEFAKELQLWYAKDKTQSAQKELFELLAQ